MARIEERAQGHIAHRGVLRILDGLDERLHRLRTIETGIDAQQRGLHRTRCLLVRCIQRLEHRCRRVGLLKGHRAALLRAHTLLNTVHDVNHQQLFHHAGRRILSAQARIHGDACRAGLDQRLDRLSRIDHLVLFKIPERRGADCNRCFRLLTRTRRTDRADRGFGLRLRLQYADQRIELFRSRHLAQRF